MRLTSTVAAVVAVVAVAGSGLLALPGCLLDDKGPEEELAGLDGGAFGGDGKADSFRRPTDHGPVGFAAPETAALTADERYHTWGFELTGPARVEMTTLDALTGQAPTDTVLYLYKGGAAGWGPYRYRNDDHAGRAYSRLVRPLDAGRYRVLVKGHAEATRGQFAVAVSCSGDGCVQPAAASACLFGPMYGYIPRITALGLRGKTVVMASNLATFSAADQAMLLQAVRASPLGNVADAGAALRLVDGHQISAQLIAEPGARRDYIAFEFGVGLRAYGAIFEHVSGAQVSRIADGLFYECTVVPETCALPADGAALQTDPAFTLVDELATAASDAQVRDAVPAAATATVRHYLQGATGTLLTAVEAQVDGDAAGAIYYGDTLQRAATVSSEGLGGCSLFVR